MRTAALGATCFVAVSLLGGCGGAVGQGKPNAPVVVVGSAEAPKKATLKAKPSVVLSAKEAETAGILGVLGAMKGDEGVANIFGGDVGDSFGGVVGGVVAGTGSGFGSGGLGLSGIGIGGGGRGEGLGGLGSIGTIGRGSGAPGHAWGSSSGQVTPKFGQVVVTGPLTVDVVQRYVDDHRDDVQTCHKLEHERTGTRWGTLTLAFTIDTTGHVSEVHVSNSTITSRDLESCIAHATGSFEFPAPRTGEVQVLLPITF